MAHDELHIRLARRSNHVAAVLQRERHRLFDQDMLLAGSSGNGMGGVELVRRRHVPDLYRVVRAERFNGIKAFRAEFGFEPGARFRARVGAGNKLHARIGAEGARHERKRAPQSGDSEF